MSCRAALLLIVFMSQNLAAQARPIVQTGSPVMDLLEKAKNSLNNLQYTQARTTVREVLALGKLKRSLEIATLQVASAAYYPDEPSARMPDSAAIFLKRLARIMPAGPLPVDLVSPGLDSQLVIARQSTFGVSAQVPIEVTLRGTEPRQVIEIASTRPARWQLFLVAADGGPPILLDTLSNATFGRFSLKAHTGVTPTMQPGQYQFRILAISMSEPDSVTLRFDMVAKGAVPSLMDLPGAPNPARFLPERSPKAIGAGIAGGLIVGGATWALANLLHPPKSLGAESEDSQGTVVAVGISLGALVAGILDKGRPNVANIKANAATKAAYLTQLGYATETNRKRVSEYVLAMTIDPELK